jgi:GTP cyclohydrolase I
MTTGVAKKIEEVLDLLRIDYRNDHNMRDTPMRVARMYLQELLHGRFSPLPRATRFENVENYDQLIICGPMELRSICAHHLMPIDGTP